MLTYNHTVLTNNGSWLTDGSVTPPAPSDEVTIGTQTWKTTNLKVDDGLGGISIGDVTYGNDVVTEYYYTQAAALRVAASIQGWHVPTVDEYKALFTYIGGRIYAGKKLKSIYGWANGGNGTDEYGFTLLPAGYYVNKVTNANNLVDMLTSDTANNKPYEYGFNYQTNGATLINQDGMKFVVRLIKD